MFSYRQNEAEAESRCPTFLCSFLLILYTVHIFTFSCVANEWKIILMSYNCVEISFPKPVPKP